MFSGAQIVALRKRRGFSQEALAEQSGVSLRTIQRVEQGDTVPRGHTLQALAAALEVPLDAFRAEPAAPAPSAETEAPALRQAEAMPSEPAAEPAAAPALPLDPGFVQLLNLSALCFLVFPFLNLLVPYLLWRKHRHDTAHVAEVGRRLLGFQMLWQVGSFFAYMMAMLVQAAAFFYFGARLQGLFLVVFALTYIINVAAVGYNQMLLRRGQYDVYRIRL